MLIVFIYSFLFQFIHSCLFVFVVCLFYLIYFWNDFHFHSFEKGFVLQLVLRIFWIIQKLKWVFLLPEKKKQKEFIHVCLFVLLIYVCSIFIHVCSIFTVDFDDSFGGVLSIFDFDDFLSGFVPYFYFQKNKIK